MDESAFIVAADATLDKIGLALDAALARLLKAQARINVRMPELPAPADP